MVENKSHTKVLKVKKMVAEICAIIFTLLRRNYTMQIAIQENRKVIAYAMGYHRDAGKNPVKWTRVFFKPKPL
jgi:hypothetical protein